LSNDRECNPNPGNSIQGPAVDGSHEAL